MRVYIRRMFASEAAIRAMKFRFSTACDPQMSIQSPLVLVPLRTLWTNIVSRLGPIHRLPFLDPKRRIHETTSSQMPLQMTLRGVRTVAEVASIFPDVEVSKRGCNTQATHSIYSIYFLSVRSVSKRATRNFLRASLWLTEKPALGKMHPLFELHGERHRFLLRKTFLPFSIDRVLSRPNVPPPFPFFARYARTTCTGQIQKKRLFIRDLFLFTFRNNL